MFSCMCMFCRSLFAFSYFFFWPLCCLFFDLRILTTPLVSSNSFYHFLFFLENKDTIVLFAVILGYTIATIDNSPTFAIDIHKLKQTFVIQQTKNASRLIITYKCNRGRFKTTPNKSSFKLVFLHCLLDQCSNV